MTHSSHTARSMHLEPLDGSGREPIALDGSRASVSIGRLRELVDHAIDDSSVSRRHAIARRISGLWHLSDLGSSHGTYVNGARIGRNPVRIEAGDRLAFGPIAYRVSDGTTSLTEATSRTMVTSDDASVRGDVHRRPLTEDGTGFVIRDAWLRELISDVRDAEDETSLYRSAARSLARLAGGGRCLFVRRNQGFESIEILASWPEDPDPESAISPSRTLLQEASEGAIAMLGGMVEPGRAQSILSAGVSEAVCAPLRVDGHDASYVYFDTTTPTRLRGDDLAGAVESVASIGELILGKLSKRMLDARMEHVERELVSAREAQMRLMPPETGVVGGRRYTLVSHAGFYVAGDVFGISVRPGGEVVAYLGDVTGHGVAPSLVMSATKSHLDALLESERPLPEIIERVNAYIAGVTSDDQFVTLIAIEIDPSGHTMKCVDAGHGYVLFADEEGAITKRALEGGLPLGIDVSNRYGHTIVDASGVSRVVLLSDGIAEQRDASGREFGMKRVIDCLTQDAAASFEGLFDELLKHCDGEGFSDDVTVASIGVQ